MRGPIEGLKAHAATFILGIFLAVGATFFFLSFGQALPQGDTYRVKAALPTSASLVKGARVTMAGIKVGKVGGIRREGFSTVVDLDLTDESVVPIPEDTKVTLRQRTPVGESYVALTPGDAKEGLPDGGALPIEQSEEYVDVDQVLSTLQGPARDDVRKLVQGLGEGLRGRGDELNATVGRGTDVLKSGSELFSELSVQREQVAGVIARLGRVSAAVGERGESVRVLARRGLTSLRAIASRDAALRRTLGVLPSTLAQVQSSSVQLGRVSDIATPVVADASAALREVRPAIAALRPAAQEGRELVREVDRTALPFADTLERLTRASKPVASALPALRSTLCELTPMVRFVKPYTDDALAVLIGLGSASNSYDAIGHLIRLDPVIGENSLAGAPKEVSEAGSTLLRSGLLRKANDLSWNPYPQPGQIGKDFAGREGKSFTGPADLGKSSYRFPRVMADC